MALVPNNSDPGDFDMPQKISECRLFSEEVKCFDLAKKEEIPSVLTIEKTHSICRVSPSFQITLTHVKFIIS